LSVAPTQITFACGAAHGHVGVTSLSSPIPSVPPLPAARTNSVSRCWVR